LGGLLGSECGALSRALETNPTSRAPTDRITLNIGDCDHRIVEGRHDISDAYRDIFGSLGTDYLCRLQFIAQKFCGGGGSGRGWRRPRGGSRDRNFLGSGTLGLGFFSHMKSGSNLEWTQ
jgi:hypothetical protein